MKIADLWKQIETAGGRPFMIRPSGTVSYAELRSSVAKAFTSLGTIGVQAGRPIAVLMEDEAKASAVFLAALLRGNVPIMLPFDIGGPRLEAIRRTSEPELIARDDSLFACEEPSTITLPEISQDNLAYLLFTSGTTAAPSGVEITHGNLCSHLDTLIRLFSFSTQTRIFNPTPVAHTDGLIFGPILAMATGGAVIRPGPMHLARFDEWIGMARAHGATHVMTNPTVLSLIDRTADRDDYFTFDGFRGILSSGSQLRRNLWIRFEERFHTQLWNLYGLTETVTSVLYSGRHPEMGPVGTLGSAVDCEARIAQPFGPTGAASTEPGIGELQVRGAHVCRGYWKNPERNAQTFVDGGWMRTGDLVRDNGDGSFDFLGRVKTAINSGGTLIRGEEIDECLLRHPSVAECVTVGLPDDEFEEIAVSAVVPRRGVEATESALTKHCRDELESLKVPKRIVIVDTIPRGDAGKPNLAAVRELLERSLRQPTRPTHEPPNDTDRGLLELAALVFGVAVSDLSLSSTPQTVEGWDSFRHVNLVLQVEDEFGVRIPGTLLPSIKSLRDLSALIQRLKS